MSSRNCVSTSACRVIREAEQPLPRFRQDTCRVERRERFPWNRVELPSHRSTLTGRSFSNLNQHIYSILFTLEIRVAAAIFSCAHTLWLQEEVEAAAAAAAAAPAALGILEAPAVAAYTGLAPAQPGWRRRDCAALNSPMATLWLTSPSPVFASSSSSASASPPCLSKVNGNPAGGSGVGTDGDWPG